MTHKYIFIYTFQKGNKIGTGHEVFTTNGKLKEAGIKEMIDTVQKQTKVDNVIVLNAIELNIPISERIKGLILEWSRLRLQIIENLKVIMEIEEKWYKKEGGSNGSTKSEES